MKALIGCWALAVCVGFGALARYDGTPGRQIEAPDTLPSASSARPVLTVFIHPECGCTSATLGELERIQAQTQGKLDIVVDAVVPKGDKSWLQAANVVRARNNAGWRFIVDAGGRIAASMGAQTSGFCLLADKKGKKVFQGGITLTRGHEGDNPGHDAIVSYVNEGAISITSTPVYGCSLGSLGAL